MRNVETFLKIKGMSRIIAESQISSFCPSKGSEAG